MALRRLPVRIAIAVAVSVLFYCVAVEYPSWGHGKAFTKDRPKWQNEPALKLTDEDRLKVLTTLLEQNRQEIRFWQDKLFTISFLFTGLILGIVVFTLKQKPDTAILRRLAAGSCLGLCFFYFLYVEFAEGAISVNDYDLIGIQYGLKLSEEDQYLLKKQRIYGAGDPAGHPHIKELVRFNVVLTISAAVLLFFLPLQPEPGGGNGNAKRRDNEASGTLSVSGPNS